MLNLIKRPWLIDRINALPYRVLFLLWSLNIVLFACAYTALSFSPGNGPSGLSELPLLKRFGASLYYSVITATNTGYGDIVPLGYSRIFAATQSVLELFLFALFIAKLVSSRQDMTLQEVHQLSFELMFHNIREDFYVARKDFDHIVHTVRANKALSEEDWERLTIAYQHITSLLKEIPNFYDVTSDLYVIDPRREVLLLEAVQRTTGRINHTLDVLKRSSIEWHKNPENIAELADMVHTLDSLIPLWLKHSHDQNHDAFVKIENALAALHTHVAHTS